jgi:hypothetical protein
MSAQAVVLNLFVRPDLEVAAVGASHYLSLRRYIRSGHKSVNCAHGSPKRRTINLYEPPLLTRRHFVATIFTQVIGNNPKESLNFPIEKEAKSPLQHVGNRSTIFSISFGFSVDIILLCRLAKANPNRLGNMPTSTPNPPGSSYCYLSDEIGLFPSGLIFPLSLA